MADEASLILPSERFQALWQRCLTAPFDSMAINVIYEDLIARYGEPIRHYHNSRHIRHCLNEFDRAAYLIEQPDTVELALWFHDAIYVVGARDNEQRSADLFAKWAVPVLAPDQVATVNRFIMATRHRKPPDDDDERYVVDIDLSSFGLEWAAFINDTVNVRNEMIYIPDELYYANHIGFLNGLLMRERIFYSDFFYNAYEHIARQNINRLLASPGYLEAMLQGSERKIKAEG